MILSPRLRCKVGRKGKKRRIEQSDNLYTLIHIPCLPYPLKKNQCLWALNSESWMLHEKDSLSFSWAHVDLGRKSWALTGQPHCSKISLVWKLHLGVWTAPSNKNPSSLNIAPHAGLIWIILFCVDTQSSFKWYICTPKKDVHPQTAFDQISTKNQYLVKVFLLGGDH